MKHCTKCGLKLVDTEFSRCRQRRDGLQAKCKSCARNYYLANRERTQSRQRGYYEKNKTKVKARVAEYRAKNIELARQRSRDYYRVNKERHAEKRREYSRDNRDRLNLWLSGYRQARKQTDPGFKAMCHLRSRLWHALNGKAKADSTEALIGCSSSELVTYLESLFQPGMSWDNYGFRGWHVDHIVPCKDFDLRCPEEQRECFHYANLRPLWAADNLSRKQNLPRE